MPTLDLPAVKKAVQADLKEMKKACDSLKSLGARKKHTRDDGQQLLQISMAARERARGASRTLREALSIAQEGTNEHKVVSALSEEFRQTLLKFQQQVEAVSHLASAAEPAAPGSASGVDALESGTWGGSVPSEQSSGGWGSQAQEQQQIETNENMLREREEGIGALNRSVQEVAEIFQDLALLVNEQGTQIDNIQTNIETAAESTNRGVRELARASRSQRRARGRMCLIAACVLAVLVILVLILKFGLKKI